MAKEKLSERIKRATFKMRYKELHTGRRDEADS